MTKIEWGQQRARGAPSLQFYSSVPGASQVTGLRSSFIHSFVQPRDSNSPLSAPPRSQSSSPTLTRKVSPNYSATSFGANPAARLGFGTKRLSAQLTDDKSRRPQPAPGRDPRSLAHRLHGTGKSWSWNTNKHTPTGPPERLRTAPPRPPTPSHKAPPPLSLSLSAVTCHRLAAARTVEPPRRDFVVSHVPAPRRVSLSPPMPAAPPPPPPRGRQGHWRPQTPKKNKIK